MTYLLAFIFLASIFLSAQGFKLTFKHESEEDQQVANENEAFSDFYLCTFSNS